MSLDTALFGYLSTHADLGPLVGTRIYPLLAPQQAVLPYLVYTEIDYSGVQHMRGASPLATATYQLDVYATTYLQSSTIAELLRLALDGLFDRVIGGVDIRWCHMGTRRRFLEDDEGGSQEMYYRVSTDFTFGHFRTVTVFA